MDSPKPIYRKDGQVANLANISFKPSKQEEVRAFTVNDYEDHFGDRRPVPNYAVGTAPGIFEAPEEEKVQCIFGERKVGELFPLEPTSASDPEDLLYSMG